MKVFVKSFLCLNLFFLLSINTYSQDFEDGCAEVLRLSSKDVERSYKKANIAKYIYENYCSGSSSKSGVSISAGIDELLNSYDFGFGSTKQKIKNICETYQDQYFEKTEESSYSSTTVREAISAWLACKELNKKGVLVKPVVQKTMATIDFKQTGPDRITITGVRYDPSCLNCEAAVEGGFFGRKSTIEVNSETRHRISSNEVWSVACDRLPKVENGVKLYVETDLAILTSQGTFKLTLPADEKIPFNWSSEMNQKILDLSNLYTEKMDAIKVVATTKGDGKVIKSPRVGGPTECECPEGYAVVGINVEKGIGGKYATDAIGQLKVTCQKIELQKK